MVIISVLLNWNEHSWSDMSVEIGLSAIVLLGLNGGAWFIEWLLRQIASTG